MDKKSIINVKKSENYFVHEMPGGMSEFHDEYGLWIFSYRRNAISSSRTELKPRYFEFYGLAHIIRSSGWYWNKSGKKEKAGTGDCIISTPGFVQDYAGEDENYTEDSICFSGKIADRLCRCGIIRNGVFNMGNERRLLAIFELVDDPSHDSQIKANFELQKLLMELYFNNKTAHKKDKHSQFDYLLENIQTDPQKWWNSAEMAEICNLSESQFRIVFQKKTGMKPKTYLDRFKMQKASELLCNSKKSIAEIAADLGYLDPYHFSRRFKQVAGLAPEHYRQQYLIS